MHSSSENSHFSKIGIFYAKMNCYHGKLWKISGLLLEIYIMQGISWTFMRPRGKRLRWSARTSSENVSLRIPLVVRRNVVRRNTTNLAFFNDFGPNSLHCNFRWYFICFEIFCAVCHEQGIKRNPKYPHM